jgi:hypothetical protein
MIYLLGCCPIIGWGATIHDLVLDFHILGLRFICCGFFDDLSHD